MADFVVTLSKDSMCVIEARDIDEAIALVRRVFVDHWWCIYSPEEWAMFTSETDTVYQEVARVRRCTDEGFAVAVTRHSHEHVTCPRPKDCTWRSDTES